MGVLDRIDPRRWKIRKRHDQISATYARIKHQVETVQRAIDFFKGHAEELAHKEENQHVTDAEAVVVTAREQIIENFRYAKIATLSDLEDSVDQRLTIARAAQAHSERQFNKEREYEIDMAGMCENVRLDDQIIEEYRERASREPNKDTRTSYREGEDPITRRVREVLWVEHCWKDRREDAQKKTREAQIIYDTFYHKPLEEQLELLSDMQEELNNQSSKLEEAAKDMARENSYYQDEDAHNRRLEVVENSGEFYSGLR